MTVVTDPITNIEGLKEWFEENPDHMGTPGEGQGITTGEALIAGVEHKAGADAMAAATKTWEEGELDKQRAIDAATSAVRASEQSIPAMEAAARREGGRRMALAYGGAGAAPGGGGRSASLGEAALDAAMGTADARRAGAMELAQLRQDKAGLVAAMPTRQEDFQTAMAEYNDRIDAFLGSEPDKYQLQKFVGQLLYEELVGGGHPDVINALKQRLANVWKTGMETFVGEDVMGWAPIGD